MGQTKNLSLGLHGDYETDLDGAGALKFSVVVDKRQASPRTLDLVDQVLELFAQYEDWQEEPPAPPAPPLELEAVSPPPAGSDQPEAAGELIEHLVVEADPRPSPPAFTPADMAAMRAVVANPPVVTAEPEPSPQLEVPRFPEPSRPHPPTKPAGMDLRNVAATVIDKLGSQRGMQSKERVRAGEKAAEYWREHHGQWPTGSMLMEIARVGQHAAYHGLRDVKKIAAEAGVIGPNKRK